MFSSFFTGLNGVKQGGVISPVLFCLYIDNLLIQLAQSGVGCYIGNTFVGALAYADDIVLVAPTPSALRQMLSICESYANLFNIKFNTNKSKCMLVPGYKQAASSADMLSECKFYLDGRLMENVQEFSHLGHIITTKLGDTEDILNRRCRLIGQINSVLCYFKDLNSAVKVRLLNAYCLSLYGCELWDLGNSHIQAICVAYRKGLRRCFDLPYESHSFLLPGLAGTLPLFYEISKRSLRFVYKCLFGSSSLVRSVVWHSIHDMGCKSVVTSNIHSACKLFGLRYDSFLHGKVCVGDDSLFRTTLTEEKYRAIKFTDELIQLRDGWLGFSNTFSLSRCDLKLMIDYVTTANA